MKDRQLKIIKRDDIAARTSARKEEAAARIESKAANRRGRRTGNAEISSWIAERREAERISRLALLKIMSRGLLPRTKQNAK